MKNHFFIPYSGNKREEVEHIYNSIKDRLNEIEYIIEPFCGSSAFSYYLSTLHPKKFKYILNDNNNLLIELYNISKDEIKYNKLINDMNMLFKNIKTKSDYDKIVKQNNLEGYLLGNKLYAIRPYLYPINKIDGFKGFDYMKTVHILDFIRNENITFTSKNALEIYDMYKTNNKALIFLDPPYLGCDNSFYKSPSSEIYEYLFNNDIEKEKAYICLCLGNIWIIRLLFKNKKFITYEKKYQTTKKKIEHIIILNK